MAVDQPAHSKPTTDLALEYHALKRCLTPMPDDPDRRVLAKFVAAILVILWSVITVAVSFGAAVVPPHWLPFTALVFLIVGRLWSIEVYQLLPGAYGSTDDSDCGSSGGDES